MKTVILASLAAALTFISATPASAQVNDRQWRQQHRIEQGVRRGDLNRREYYRLQRQQARINRYEQRSRWDGRGLSRHERARLNRMQNRASRNIYAQRRDRQFRGRW